VVFFRDKKFRLANSSNFIYLKQITVAVFPIQALPLSRAFIYIIPCSNELQHDFRPSGHYASPPPAI
jgi:hypothetical protein